MDSPLEIIIGKELNRRKQLLSVAESCSGGLLAHLITEVPGSSVYFLGGVVAYSNYAKEKFLGVQSATLEEFGAVSEETALEMAVGVRNAFNADYGLGVTGIAGPGSDQTNKPVGLTWIALSSAHAEIAEMHVWEGNRSRNKQQSAETALKLLLNVFEQD
jgi:PncC family amidohydrolase